MSEKGFQFRIQYKIIVFLLAVTRRLFSSFLLVVEWIHSMSNYRSRHNQLFYAGVGFGHYFADFVVKCYNLLKPLFYPGQRVLTQKNARGHFHA